MFFQVSSRKSYKHEDMEDEEETVVLFSREGEGSHDLDWAQILAPTDWALIMAWAQILVFSTELLWSWWINSWSSLIICVGDFIACAVIVRLKPLSSAVLLRSPDLWLRDIFSHLESTCEGYIFSLQNGCVFIHHLFSVKVVNEAHVFTNLERTESKSTLNRGAAMYSSLCQTCLASLLQYMLCRHTALRVPEIFMWSLYICLNILVPCDLHFLE